MKKTILIISIVAIILAVVVIIIFPKKKIAIEDNKVEDYSYIEIVKEDRSCKENCFLEYILLSDGVIMEKFINSFDDKNTNGVNLWKTEDNIAGIFDDAIKITQKYGNNKGIECENCVTYRLYRRDGKTTSSYSSTEESTPNEIRALIDKIIRLKINSMPSDGGFIHFYYGTKNAKYVDYHIFSNGAVIREIFGARHGELLEAEIYSISQEKIYAMQSLIKEDFYEENNMNYNCSEREYLWGYLEIKMRDGYNYVFTCADGKNNSDAIFDYLFHNIDK